MVTVSFDASRLTSHASRLLGAWTIDLSVAPGVTIVDCQAADGGVCNPSYAPGVVRISGASASGLRGAATLATLTLDGTKTKTMTALRATGVALTDSNGAPLGSGGR